MSRKICVVTGTRADYGHLRSVIRAIQAQAGLQLQVLATAAHLSPEFGSTVREIEADGVEVAEKVEMLLSADTATAITKSMGLGLIGFADAFARLAPDVVLLLGDRFEALAAAQAALIARIPIAHLHGGETSEGAYDESMRHAITKMAQWHFVAAEPYRQRVIQLGEDPGRVLNVGAPGLDHLADGNWMEREELEQSLGLPFGAPLLLVTYHPETLAHAEPAWAMGELVAALETFPTACVVITYPNADSGGRALFPIIDAFAARSPGRRKALPSLGQHRYLSLMRIADAVVGNSSSGLIEAPALHRATLNIGDRQKGRLRAASVMDVPANRDAIVEGLRHVLSPQFQSSLVVVQSPYGVGSAGQRIASRLAEVPLEVAKRFHDIAPGG